MCHEIRIVQVDDKHWCWFVRERPSSAPILTNEDYCLTPDLAWRQAMTALEAHLSATANEPKGL